MSGGAASPLPAGHLVTWLGSIMSSIKEGTASELACGSCDACCRASQFILVTADDIAARSAIPPELLFPAPGMPAGDHVMGYDAHGHCPMLSDAGCTIYQSRPQACRTYDCRVFAATGIDVRIDGRADVASQVERWQFDLSDGGAELLAALRAAGAHVSSHRTELGLPGTTAQAIAAIARVTQA